VALATFMIPTVWGTPWSVNVFYMRALLQTVWQEPQLCSSLHLLDVRGGELDDLSVAQRERGNALIAHTRATLHRYDRASMTPADQDSYDVMDFYLSQHLDIDSGKPGVIAFSPYAIEPMSGVHTSFPSFLTTDHDVRSKRDVEHYIARLEKAGQQFDEVIATSNADAAHGVIPPRSALLSVARDARAFVAIPTAKNPLVTTFKAKLADVAGLDEAQRTALLERATRAVDDVVKPAYGRYIDATVALTKRATDELGLWHTVGGDARYARFLRLATASDLSPGEIHAESVARAERVADELRSTFAKLGMPAEGALAALLEKATGDPRFAVAATPEGRAQTLASFQKILDENVAGLDHVSHLPLSSTLVVEPEPKFLEGTGPAAHYEPPPTDDSKPGVFKVDLSKWWNRCDLRELAAHEGVPGHHFQQTVARHQTDLPMFRQLIPFTAYIEGWAMWAEVLMQDSSMDACERIGFLTSRLVTATGCAVDTGIHAKKWTRADADEYATKYGQPFDLERLLVWPGQACAYFVGELTIERLADKARAALGPKFDIQGFDDAILTAGAVPMPLLEKLVDRWIAGRK